MGGGYYSCDCGYFNAPGNGGDGGPCIEQIDFFPPNGISVATLDSSLFPGAGGLGGYTCTGGLCCQPANNGSPGQQGPQFIVPPQQLQQLSGSSRKFQSPSVVRANAPATLSCYGIPGDTYQVFLSPALGFTYVPSMHGVQLLQPPAQLIVSGIVPSNGLFAPTITLPPLDGADCMPLYLQAYVRDTNSQRFICAQMTLLEVDPRF
jgi:hypothetical protein